MPVWVPWVGLAILAFLSQRVRTRLPIGWHYATLFLSIAVVVAVFWVQGWVAGVGAIGVWLLASFMGVARGSPAGSELGQSVALVMLLEKELKQATTELGFGDTIQFMATTRGEEEARAVASMVMQVLAFNRGEWVDVNQALAITNTLVTILWGELGQASERLGHANNAMEYLRATKGDEYAMSLTERVLRVSRLE
jgi:hypothetical protein